MCTRHDVGRIKDREPQKTDEGTNIGTYWNRQRLVCRRLQCQVRKRARVTCTVEHAQPFCEAFGQDEREHSAAVRHSWLAYRHQTSYDKNHLHVAIRLESPLAGELDHADMGRTAELIHPQPFCKAFGLDKMGRSCFESQRTYTH